MRRVLNVMLLVLVGLSPAFLARPAAAADMTWTMNSGKPYQIDMKFFSRDGDRVWPGNNDVYVLPRHATRTYTLACRPGATICYGAWPDDGPPKHWGVGRSVNNACSNCCYVCGRDNPSRNLVD
jgi:hypothetical protein